MTEAEQIQKRIESLKDRMLCSEMSDNFYYTSGRRGEHLRLLYDLERQLKECQATQAKGE